MPKMSEERLAKYRKMDKDLFEFDDPAITAWFTDAMEKGVRLSAAHGPSRFTGLFQSPQVKSADGLDIAVLGIPMDTNAMGTAGTRHGPHAIRTQSLIDIGAMHDVTEKVPFMQCTIGDLGDVVFSRAALEDRLEDIYASVKALADTGAMPLILGGEHTATYSTLRALSDVHDESLALIHIDAHGDTMSALDGDRVNDGSCMRYGVLDGAIDPEKTIQIGIRNSYSKLIWKFSYDSGMTVITGQEVHDKGMPYVIAKVREIVGDSKTYFTFDSDGLCASAMYGTTNPELFGLTPWQARELMLGCRGLNIIGADYMEHNPIKDPSGYSTLVSTMMVFELLAMLADSREAATGRTNPTIWPARS